MPQSVAIVEAVKACWAPKVYIPELSNRFWRMTLQIMSRYQSWLEKSVPALYEGHALVNLGMAGPPEGATVLTLPIPT